MFESAFSSGGAVIALRLDRKLYQHYCSKGASVIKRQHIRACPHRKGIMTNQWCYNLIGCGILGVDGIVFQGKPSGYCHGFFVKKQTNQP